MNRSELLFIYDVENSNPNGDPLDENKPRMDEETEINIVTDVRLKRTIRDYLEEYAGEELFVKEKKDDEGKGIQDAKSRALDYLKEEVKDKTFEEQKDLIKNEILKDCIDVRLFGATIPLKLKVKNKDQKGSITLTGPVQFRIGKSLHKVDITYILGNGAFASKKGSSQKTFRSDYILPYSLISFYGIVNQHAAETTNMNEEDLKKLLDGMWNGTKNLISRSKFGQMPRLLLQIEYSNNFFIGDLNNKISIEHDLDDKKLRKISEIKLEYQDLLESLNKYKENIEKISYKVDGDFDIGNLIKDIEELGISTEKLE